MLSFPSLINSLESCARTGWYRFFICMYQGIGSSGSGNLWPSPPTTSRPDATSASLSTAAFPVLAGGITPPSYSASSCPGVSPWASSAPLLFALRNMASNSPGAAPLPAPEADVVLPASSERWRLGAAWRERASRFRRAGRERTARARHALHIRAAGAIFAAFVVRSGSRVPGCSLVTSRWDFRIERPPSVWLFVVVGGCNSLGWSGDG